MQTIGHILNQSSYSHNASKVSDVKKEQELAERRKNDPALNQTQDHLVRKLFSKFRKGGQESSIPLGGSSKDLERGEHFFAIDNGMVPGETLRLGKGSGVGGGKNFKNRIAASESGGEGCNIHNMAGTANRTKPRGWARFKGSLDDTTDNTKKTGCNNEMNSK